MNNRETVRGHHQILAIREARARSASTSARQTSSAGALFRLPAGNDAFLAATEAVSGLRMLRYPGNSKGLGMTEAFANTQPSLTSASC